MLLDFMEAEHLGLLTNREVKILKSFLRSIRPVLPNALANARGIKNQMKVPRVSEHPTVVIRILSELYDRNDERQFAVDVMHDGEIFLYRLDSEVPNPRYHLATVGLLSH